MGHEIKVMSFNVRYNNPNDGVNQFDLRRDKVLEVLEREDPDLIGFQEITPDMQEWLKKVLGSRYTVLGHGREADFSNEGNPIAYRTSRFELHSFSLEWLSETPDVPGSRLRDLDQSGCPRIYCCAELIDLSCKKRFAFFNTHTDHKGAKARMFECEMLLDRIRKKTVPYVMTGDFNDYPESASIKLIMDTHEELGTRDATSSISGTFHGFSMTRMQNNNEKIDYIFTNLSHDPARSYAVEDNDDCGYFYSDHRAVCAYVSMETLESISKGV